MSLCNLNNESHKQDMHGFLVRQKNKDASIMQYLSVVGTTIVRQKELINGRFRKLLREVVCPD
jgi:hypothetical protein